MPDGFEVDAATQTKFLGIMNDKALSPGDRLQRLVDLQAEAVKGMSERAGAAWSELQTKWQDEVRADATIGGDKLEGVLGGIAKLLDAHGSPELRQVFADTGAGNNVHMVRFLNNIARQLNEPGPGPVGTVTATPKSLEERIFPNMTK